MTDWLSSHLIRKESSMERIIECVVGCSGLFVPVLALWAVTALYTMRSGVQCTASQVLYFLALLIMAAMTIRTVIANDGCWLVHTSSLGVTIVAGVMRRPEAASDAYHFQENYF
jgi:hypothetical protein